MKIQLLSDLHLEFAPFEITNAGGVDTLILSGDIAVAQYFLRGKESPKYATAQVWKTFFGEACREFDNVIYILGNHEHYHGRFGDTASILRQHLNFPNLTILDLDYVDIDGIRFIGSTLWTDFNNDSFAAKLAVKNSLNDYHVVQNVVRGNYRKLNPDDTLNYHRKALQFIDFHSKNHDNVVVIGHHAPSYRSIEEKYRDATLMNFGYYSNLEQFIFDRPQIKLWTHGHVHSSHDYQIGNTRIACNPRGYTRPGGNPENPNFDPMKVFIV